MIEFRWFDDATRQRRTVTIDPATPAYQRWASKVGEWPTGAEHLELRQIALELRQQATAPARAKARAALEERSARPDESQSRRLRFRARAALLLGGD